ncbi:unnamed protein product [Schistosoma spindalis]|nr:unnamed protein product [Schistosoma spindale]
MSCRLQTTFSKFGLHAGARIPEMSPMKEENWRTLTLCTQPKLASQVLSDVTNTVNDGSTSTKPVPLTKS